MRHDATFEVQSNFVSCKKPIGDALFLPLVLIILRQRMYFASYGVRDEIKSFGKFAILYLYKIGEGGGPWYFWKN